MPHRSAAHPPPRHPIIAHRASDRARPSLLRFGAAPRRRSRREEAIELVAAAAGRGRAAAAAGPALHRIVHVLDAIFTEFW